jgi:RHS repeat-associated protein
MDKETGNYYYRVRYYDAETGRFLNEDPLTTALYMSNPYVYVGNSPLNFIDPLGMAKCQVAFFIADILEQDKNTGEDVAMDFFYLYGAEVERLRRDLQSYADEYNADFQMAEFHVGSDLENFISQGYRNAIITHASAGLPFISSKRIADDSRYQSKYTNLALATAMKQGAETKIYGCETGTNLSGISNLKGQSTEIDISDTFEQILAYMREQFKSGACAKDEEPCKEK